MKSQKLNLSDTKYITLKYQQIYSYKSIHKSFLLWNFHIFFFLLFKKSLFNKSSKLQKQNKEKLY